MRPTLLLTAGLSLAGGALAQTTPSSACASLHVIALRGLNQVNDPDLYQFLIGSVNIIKSTVPGSDSLGLPYRANATLATDGINNGTLMLQDYVADYVASCPRSKIAILGYSDGAVSTSNAICGGITPYALTAPLAAKYASNVVATVVWGDLTRAPFQPWDQGTCPIFMPGITLRVNSAQCQPFASGYLNYCNTGDGFCCSSVDTSNDAHHTYQNFYTNSTAQWVIQKYQASL